MTDFIPVNQPLFCGNERKYLMEAIDSGWISSEGSFVQQFEETFAKRVHRKYGIAVSSGSAALDIAVSAAGLGEGDEVIMPSFTIISPALSIIRIGAKPVLVDSDPITWNMDVKHIESKITKRTRAIIAVHTYGLPVDMKPLLNISEEYGLTVIEDAAEMHGQTYRKRPCGSFGLISVFSFYANKLVTCGEGGIVVTDDETVAEHCRSLRNLCFSKGRRFIHHDLGWNYRLTNLQAAVALAQLERLDESVAYKRHIGKMYTELLDDIPILRLPLEETDYAENIYWVYGVVMKKQEGLDAPTVMNRLASRGVDSRPFFWPMHRQPVFREMGLFTDDECPIADRLAHRGFYIPSGLGITDNQIRVVADTLRSVLF